jgi:hypothetical protein
MLPNNNAFPDILPKTVYLPDDECRGVGSQDRKQVAYSDLRLLTGFTFAALTDS